METQTKPRRKAAEYTITWEWSFDSSRRYTEIISATTAVRAINKAKALLAAEYAEAPRKVLVLEAIRH